ncbi:hypothetical protein CF394_00705 [Tetzosporium hominis]|uniref:Uncharacterized protein n=1 Tax=Tetzosporium hominis TaxID=2020506 RepID=A0A264W8W0_9BACL|nr:hypothetical protein [Tetzosporium hominis]OZS79457.1 hypothetical protein CF394_00705 [Tetzosporium hominis]
MSSYLPDLKNLLFPEHEDLEQIVSLSQDVTEVHYNDSIKQAAEAWVSIGAAIGESLKVVAQILRDAFGVLYEEIVEINRKEDALKGSRQQPAKLIHVRLRHPIHQIKKLNHQVTNRMPQYPVRKII